MEESLQAALIMVPGCIGAGLDWNSIQVVRKIKLPSSIINFIQEMGRCVRQSLVHHDQFNSFTVVFALNDYVYMMERLFIPTHQDITDTEHIISIENEQSVAIICLNILCQVMFLEYGCWHVCLELHSSNPFMRNAYDNIEPCLSKCPHCDGS